MFYPYSHCRDTTSLHLPSLFQSEMPYTLRRSHLLFRKQQFSDAAHILLQPRSLKIFAFHSLKQHLLMASKSDCHSPSSSPRPKKVTLSVIWPTLTPLFTAQDRSSSNPVSNGSGTFSISWRKPLSPSLSKLSPSKWLTIIWFSSWLTSWTLSGALGKLVTSTLSTDSLRISQTGSTSHSTSLFSGVSPLTLNSASDSLLWGRSGNFSVPSVFLSFGSLDSFSKQWKVINFRGNTPSYSPISKPDIRKRKHVSV